MSMPKPIRENLYQCLIDPPLAIKTMLAGFPADSEFWDFRLAPDRFTPREMLAHVADWNPIFEDRLTLALTQDHPTILEMDEEQVAIDRGYSSLNPLESLARYVSTRAPLVEKVRALNDSDWERMAYRESIGEMSIEAQVVLITIHDAYHVREIADYVEAWKAR